MTKKTLGYIELEWKCPHCGSQNPGMTKTCTNCGSPQPEDVKFEIGQQRELITDAAKAQAAAKDADIHCPYCGARNPSDAKICTQCGGDLETGTRRESGQVLSASPIPAAASICPNCGTPNPGGLAQCPQCGAILTRQTSTPPASPSPAKTAAPPAGRNFRPWMALPLIAILLVCCVAIGYFFFHTDTTAGTVKDVAWERIIKIEALRAVTHEDWRDQVPAGGEIISCSQKFRTHQQDPAPNATEVCATAYVDKGNGAAQVEETCSYDVYADYCRYSAQEWQVVDQALAQGTDLKPYWPSIQLTSDEREGTRLETYTAHFETNAGIKEYQTDNAALFTQFLPETEWMLSINAVGQVVDVSQ